MGVTVSLSGSSIRPRDQLTRAIKQDIAAQGFDQAVSLILGHRQGCFLLGVVREAHSGPSPVAVIP